jgi:hypothetical protein
MKKSLEGTDPSGVYWKTGYPLRHYSLILIGIFLTALNFSACDNGATPGDDSGSGPSGQGISLYVEDALVSAFNGTLDEALSYIQIQSTAGTMNYTVELAGGTYTMGSNLTISTANAVVTLKGKAPAEISLSSNVSLFSISAGKLVLDNNITLKGRENNSGLLVYIEGAPPRP